MLRKLLMGGIAACVAAGGASAEQGAVPKGIPALDHVFVIMMENHAYGQIAGNPQAPFINSLMTRANLAVNYYAIAHPSNTNYLEVVGGSNFNKLSDQYPDWHNTKCVPNIIPGQATNTDVPNSGVFCPISGRNGTDAAIPVLDESTNETSAPRSPTSTASVRSRRVTRSTASRSPISWWPTARAGSLIRKACRSRAPTAST